MAWHPDMARIIEAVHSAPSIFGQRPWEAVLAGEARERGWNCTPTRTGSRTRHLAA